MFAQHGPQHGPQQPPSQYAHYSHYPQNFSMPPHYYGQPYHMPYLPPFYGDYAYHQFMNAQFHHPMNPYNPIYPMNQLNQPNFVQSNTFPDSEK